MTADIEFRGPFSFFRNTGLPCVFDRQDLSAPGIYLWTVKRGGEYLLNYVGITSKGLARRLAAHLTAYLSGQYTVYEPRAFADGVKVVAYDAGNVIEFAQQYKTLAPVVDEFLRTFHLFAAPCPELSKAQMQRVESAIIEGIWTADTRITSFCDNRRRSVPGPGTEQFGVNLRYPSGIRLAGLAGTMEV